MAHLGQKSPGGIFLARFRYAGSEYQKSLKTRDQHEAEGAICLIKATLYKLHTGQLTIPDGVEVGSFIVSGGTAVITKTEPICFPTVASLVVDYLAAQFRKARRSVGTERTHLNNLKKALGEKGTWSIDQITHSDLDQCLQLRQTLRKAETVKKVQMTIKQLFARACVHKKLPSNPAAGLERIKGHKRDASFSSGSSTCGWGIRQKPCANATSIFS